MSEPFKSDVELMNEPLRSKKRDKAGKSPSPEKKADRSESIWGNQGRKRVLCKTERAKENSERRTSASRAWWLDGYWAQRCVETPFPPPVQYSLKYLWDRDFGVQESYVRKAEWNAHNADIWLLEMESASRSAWRKILRKRDNSDTVCWMHKNCGESLSDTFSSGGRLCFLNLLKYGQSVPTVWTWLIGHNGIVPCH